jgi:hypothetical protein
MNGYKRLGATRGWDKEQNRLASFNGQECTGLDFHSAFHAADELNAQSIQPKEQ